MTLQFSDPSKVATNQQSYSCLHLHLTTQQHEFPRSSAIHLQSLPGEQQPLQELQRRVGILPCRAVQVIFSSLHSIKVSDQMSFRTEDTHMSSLEHQLARLKVAWEEVKKAGGSVETEGKKEGKVVSLVLQSLLLRV